LLSMAPHALLVDLCHLLPAHDILAAAFLLYQATPFFPCDSIHLVVVDPGVGSDRRALAARTACGTFVAPDNGVLSLVLDCSEVSTMVCLNAPEYWRSAVSATFHGRDIFAPVAAHLANGLSVSSLGSPLVDPTRLPLTAPDFGSPDSIIAHVLHVDHFGTLVLDIRADQLPPRPVFELTGHEIRGLWRTYSDAVPGQLIAYVGSTRNHLEIALTYGQAAQHTGASVGTSVFIRSEDR
jgi:S-adenosylmethionine hydrolase